MKEKFYTFIIVPHSTSNSKKLTVSKKTIYLSIAGIIIFFLAFIFIIYDYATMSITREKFKNLNSKYTEQQKRIARYEKTIIELNAKLESFKNYAKKLNIIAGLEFPLALKEVGIGGPTILREIENTSPPITNKSLQTLDLITQKAEGIEKNLSTLLKFFEKQTIKLASTPSIWPTRGYISSAFGWRRDPFTGKKSFHKGIDIATRYGNPIVAPADGIVLATRYDKSYGKHIILDHNFGFTTIYAHLSKFGVKPGQRVKRGDIIGYVGRTGKTLGPHLHYEIRIHNKAVNPYNYILED
ncbi:M23 family metallopeptidase [Candidatus Aminicenantes bacterium AH-873-B07]|nr:M23 family metallopeptidase [Candidatus Aminicenantes bacterium AH-873-B07]